MANEDCPKAGDSPFSSDKHAQLILAQINKMRNGEHFCDVQLQVGKETFKVHRLVLAASSPYFAALFTGGMKESSKDVVQILGIEAGIFQILLDFIYTGIVNIGVNNVQELIVAADMLQLTEVVNLCCEFLKGQIDPLNCIGIFQFSEQIACHDLLEFTENYIHVHFLEVHSGEEFLALTKDQLIKILRSEELSIEDEYQVFLAAMQWILKDLGKRRKYVVEVLEPIRFPLLPPQRLLKYIEGEKDSMIFDCTECYDPVTKQWTTVASMNHPRCGLGVCVCYGAIYALGGWVGAEIGNTIERFDPDENKWEVVGNMAMSRYYFGCCEMQGLIYVIGGISNEGIELRSFEVYDPLSKRWSPLPPMGTRRAYLGVAALNDCIYSVGGWNETQDALHTVEKYSFEEEKWVEVASMKVPRAGMCVVAVNGLLYVSGGRSSSHDFLAPGTLDSVEVYNPHSDTWTEIGNMITSRCEGGVAVL
ncbi:actin-binding protein IPP isoform X4 [Panthera pardus]|uniref:Actin-binding protein IPP isoform X3 n=4 Tax=Felidae TaxID=9681 RepID=A0A6I9ZJ90_ACIJB|nr:actin-binding protein IPP isoform X3 [Acinonyx jubatus]XP_019305016.1 actin-binding protein IPP isoform X4 [Panthera pardus]XP_025782444.1 actin-binding protein IPP [Puma concolor]XP_030181728.1 actin-binding protein IPP isoform X3 [Lynx canadensis]XP_040326002.1 actin-binding protein IPP isoform X5 [Puma yagouaroundi]XP_043430774.1 actin-binding protein IPP isoform X4 [Prionailurus bengalensis]XP_044891669.1 actin-binding protein IPP isoform X3 [Felis catus]XP_046940814.1 actin-binding p